MATHRDPPPPEDFSDSDQQWFDRLSGKLTAATDADALREADALRRALDLQSRAEENNPQLKDALTPEAEERQWQQLQFRLRREGLTNPRPAARNRWWQAGAAVAAVLVLSVVIVMQRGEGDDEGPPYDAPPVLRGDLPVIQRAESRPRHATEALAAALRAAGLQPAIYQQGRTYTLDVNVPVEAGPQALAALRQAGLPAQPGPLRVEITRR